MNIKFHTTLLFVILFQNISAQDIVGSWKGELKIQGTRFPLILHVEKSEDTYQSTMDSPMQGATGIPVDKTTFENNQATFEITAANFVYKGKLINSKIDGILTQNGMTFSMILLPLQENDALINRPQTPKPPFNYNNEEVKITNETEGNLLAGTLVTPYSFNKKSPVFIMITGSGSQNRNAEIFGHEPFLVIAHDLAKKGIASLRLDDRGMGNSELGKDDPNSEDFAGDINSAVNYLAKRGFKNIGLIGHSEGGMIAPMVASKNKKVKSLILLSAPGIPTDELMKLQTYKIALSGGVPEIIAQKAADENEKIYAFVKTYNGNDFEKDFNTFLEKLSQNEFSQFKSDYDKQGALTFVNNNWFKYFIKQNPDDYLSKTKIPVLAINGSLDTQITSKENLEGIKKSLTQAKNTYYKMVEIPKVNHLLQTAETGNPREYSQIEETISPLILNTISDWISKLK